MRACFALALILGAAPAQAVEDYDQCLALIAADPARAEREAGDWARFGGGAPARHCYALALVEIGATGAAIDQLLGLAAEEPGLDDTARAEILAQAGEMLVETEDLVTARIVVEQAQRLAPNLADVIGLRARIHLANAEPRAAIRDLDGVLGREPGVPRLLLLRASAYRQIGQFIAARDDAVFATEQAPGNPAAWLERGRIEARIGDRANARNSFLEAVALDRDGEIGRTAQRALQRMDAGID